MTLRAAATWRMGASGWVHRNGCVSMSASGRVATVGSKPLSVRDDEKSAQLWKECGNECFGASNLNNELALSKLIAAYRTMERGGTMNSKAMIDVTARQQPESQIISVARKYTL